MIPLGDAPEQFDEREAEVWEKFKTEVNWLMESDRATVEVATRLRVRVLLNQYTEGDISRLLSCLSKMGATPADRTKVFVPDAGKDDEASEFFN